MEASARKASGEATTLIQNTIIFPLECYSSILIGPLASVFASPASNSVMDSHLTEKARVCIRFCILGAAAEVEDQRGQAPGAVQGTG